MGRTRVSLAGGCARSSKVEAQRGDPGAAPSPPAPEDSDARGEDRAAAERRPEPRTRDLSGARRQTTGGGGGEGAQARKGKMGLTARGGQETPGHICVRSVPPPVYLERASRPAPAPQAPHRPGPDAFGAPAGSPRRSRPQPTSSSATVGVRGAGCGVRTPPPAPGCAPRPGPQRSSSAAPPRARPGRWNTETLNTGDSRRRARSATQVPPLALVPPRSRARPAHLRVRAAGSSRQCLRRASASCARGGAV